MRILTANEQPAVRDLGGYRRFVNYIALHGRWRARVDWTVHGVTLACVALSSWAVACPFCKNYMPAEPGEPFFCTDCMMQGNGFRAMSVVWPDNRAEIEAVLLKRNDPNTRNWLPQKGETVETLRRENAQHGEAA